MKKVKLTLPDEVYAMIAEQAATFGFEGSNAVSVWCKMLAYQSVGRFFNRRTGIFVDMSLPEYQVIHTYVDVRKGYHGLSPEAAFMLRAAFETMKRYPNREEK